MKWWNNVLWKRHRYFIDCLTGLVVPYRKIVTTCDLLCKYSFCLLSAYSGSRSQGAGLAGSCSCCRKVNCVYYSCWKRFSVLVVRWDWWNNGLVKHCLKFSRCVASKHFSCISSVKIFFFVCYLTGCNCSPSSFANVPVCKLYLGLCATRSTQGSVILGFLGCPIRS